MIIDKARTVNCFKRNLTFFSSAREGWSYILKNLYKNKNVLLPNYIGQSKNEGSGIFDPIIENGINYDFYELDDRLFIVEDLLRQKIRSKKFDLILIVNYFGFVDPCIPDIVKLAKQNNLIVIEDSAHLFNFQREPHVIKNYVDFSFYSLHKFFPFQQGGLLVNNTDFTINLNEVDYSYDISNYDVNGIINHRREGFKLYERLLNGCESISIIRSLQEYDIPQSFPIIVHNNKREKLYFWMIDNEVKLSALYYDLIEPLKSNNKGKVDVSDNILNLPLHQDISKSTIENIVTLINKGLTEIE